ncbi:MAG: FAD-binding oxidoreductase [Acidobacteriia bacterium]|nr:FAD-binding oxidoreductase [Terriglobia bacterium]
MLELKPESAEQLAEALSTCAQAKQKILLGGAFSKNRMAGPVNEADAIMSTVNLKRVLQYEPKDLTVSVEAGMKWCDLQHMLAADGQMIPLDPPFYNQATAGGVVSANTCGPRRRLYGSPRDHVIGMRFATLEGNLIQSGGMVVKNVAGLDMGKLMIGSFGTLAALAVVNFKLTPTPPASRTFLFSSTSLTEAVEHRNRLLKGVLQPCAIDLLNPHAAARLNMEGYTLAVQVAGSATVVDRYTKELEGWRAVNDEKEAVLWTRIREFTPRFLADHEDGTVVRLSGELQQVGPMAAAAPVPFLARAGNGVCYAYFADCESASAWLSECIHRGWRGVLEFIPQRQCTTNEQWPNPGEDFALMQKIKHMLDPNHLLNRGRLYGRL